MALTKSTSKKNTTTLILLVIAVLLALSLAIYLVMQRTAQAARGNTHTSEYMQANWNKKLARNIPYPSRTPFAVLRGSWQEMGRQYGQAFGQYIRIEYDADYSLFLSSKLNPDKLGAVLDKYYEETKLLSPEMTDFVNGIGQGAAKELDGADNATALSNTQKIMLINSLFEVVIPPAWPHLAEMMGEQLQPAAASAAKAKYEPFASHAWAAWGNMTPDGGGIIGGTRDQPWFPTLYNVSYVAVPSDSRAAVTWGNVIAGHVASSAQVNANGVGLGNTIVSHSKQYFGVPALLSTAYISFFAHSAREAADILTVGTPEYRQKTDRKTLASTVGFFQAFADKNEGLVVERTGRNYAVRETGMQSEKGNYLSLANHAVASFSNDENTQATGQPMQNWTVPEAPDSSSVSRYWSLFYEFANNVGKITPDFAEKNIATMKYAYSSDGTKVTEKDGVPVWRLGLTPERWLIDNPKDPNSLPTGGNNMYYVADLKSLNVHWVQGIPSHWSGEWDSVSLRNPEWK